MSKGIFSFECHRDNDIGPMEKEMYFSNTTLGSSLKEIYVNMHQSGLIARKTTEKVLRRMGFKTCLRHCMIIERVGRVKGHH